MQDGLRNTDDFLSKLGAFFDELRNSAFQAYESGSPVEPGETAATTTTTESAMSYESEESEVESGSMMESSEESGGRNRDFNLPFKYEYSRTTSICRRWQGKRER